MPRKGKSRADTHKKSDKLVNIIDKLKKLNTDIEDTIEAAVAEKKVEEVIQKRQLRLLNLLVTLKDDQYPENSAIRGFKRRALECTFENKDPLGIAIRPKRAIWLEKEVAVATLIADIEKASKENETTCTEKEKNFYIMANALIHGEKASIRFADGITEREFTRKSNIPKQLVDVPPEMLNIKTGLTRVVAKLALMDLYIQFISLRNKTKINDNIKLLEVKKCTLDNVWDQYNKKSKSATDERNALKKEANRIQDDEVDRLECDILIGKCSKDDLEKMLIRLGTFQDMNNVSVNNNITRLKRAIYFLEQGDVPVESLNEIKRQLLCCKKKLETALSFTEYFNDNSEDSIKKIHEKIIYQSVLLDETNRLLSPQAIYEINPAAHNEEDLLLIEMLHTLANLDSSHYPSKSEILIFKKAAENCFTAGGHFIGDMLYHQEKKKICMQTVHSLCQYIAARATNARKRLQAQDEENNSLSDTQENRNAFYIAAVGLSTEWYTLLIEHLEMHQENYSEKYLRECQRAASPDDDQGSCSSAMQFEETPDIERLIARNAELSAASSAVTKPDPRTFTPVTDLFKPKASLPTRFINPPSPTLS